jgi:hypothetical protein
MVEGMSGRVWLDSSEVGKGSTFAFMLPVATPERLASLAKLILEAQTTDTDTGQSAPAELSPTQALKTR